MADGSMGFVSRSIGIDHRVFLQEITFCILSSVMFLLTAALSPI